MLFCVETRQKEDSKRGKREYRIYEQFNKKDIFFNEYNASCLRYAFPNVL